MSAWLDSWLKEGNRTPTNIITITGDGGFREALVEVQDEGMFVMLIYLQMSKKLDNLANKEMMWPSIFTEGKTQTSGFWEKVVYKKSTRGGTSSGRGGGRRGARGGRGQRGARGGRGQRGARGGEKPVTVRNKFEVLYEEEEEEETEDLYEEGEEEETEDEEDAGAADKKKKKISKSY
ncbi:nucleolin-like [Capsella rubella]|uniref:nucleolin-like n=1 Tax=Capsella rubella TaxID=81985 RepID=UPI000CD4C4E3|nr:nucleolin-like [Capsella rubella]